MTKTIGCIHGINTSPDERLGYATRWERVLRSQGLDVECVPIAWSSRGSAGGDVAGLLSHARGLEWSAEVAMGLDAILPDIVIAHSGGTVLMHGKKRQSAVINHVPVIAIGSPWGHPLWASTLYMSGWRPASVEVVDVWNVDDPITTSAMQGHRTPQGWRSVQVATPGHAVEHRDDLYLRSTPFLDALKGAITQAGG